MNVTVLANRDTAAWAGIVADCTAMKATMRRLREICDRSLSGATPTVLFTGEVGTGKRLLARGLHYNGARAARPLGEINCAAFRPSDLDELLFGPQGLLETSNGGTVFLEEIGAAPRDVQATLLMAIEDKLVRRPGVAQPIAIDLQFIASTRHDLEAMVKRGTFRTDLYHRLSVTSLALPPLRERGDDVIAIAEVLLAAIAREHGLAPPRLAADARPALKASAWPGNIRELRNELERMVLLVDEDELRAEHVRTHRDGMVAIDGTDADLAVVLTGDHCPLDKLEREVIRQALVRSNNNVSRAARFLAITRQTLLYRMKKHGFASPSHPNYLADERPVE